MTPEAINYHAHRNSLLIHALSLGCLPQDAEDIVHEVFACVLRVGRWEDLAALSDADQSRVLHCRLKSLLSKRWRDQHRQRRDISCTVSLVDAEASVLALATHATPASELDRAWAIQSLDLAIQRLRAEITDTQWSIIETALSGETQVTTHEKATSTKRRVAVHRARKRLRTMVSCDDLREALCA